MSQLFLLHVHVHCTSVPAHPEYFGHTATLNDKQSDNFHIQVNNMSTCLLSTSTVEHLNDQYDTVHFKLLVLSVCVS